MAWKDKGGEGGAGGEDVHDFLMPLASKWMSCRCDKAEVEEQVERDSSIGGQGGARLLYIPLEQPKLARGTKCFKTGKRAKIWAYWGRIPPSRLSPRAPTNAPLLSRHA
jgi:hypothetical protein